MNVSTDILDGSEPDIFAAEISDAALERAAAMVKDRTAALTIAFCSGLDECPRHLPQFDGTVDHLLLVSDLLFQFIVKLGH